jgi:hypothetical protein
METESVPATQVPTTDAPTEPETTVPTTQAPTAPSETAAPVITEHECSYVITEHVDATCSTGGWTTAVCTVCGNTVTQYQSALWYHIYENGFCVFCGQSEGAIQDTCDHVYDGGKEVWPAGTMTWEPYILYTCKYCGHTYTKLIDYLS